jgi:hypothetical protein
MTRVMLTGSLLAALAIPAVPSLALADGMFWVVGSHDTGKCQIVTTNPVVDGSNIWFGDGPYKSRSDAKLARSNIEACPKVDPSNDEADDGK